MRTQVAIIGAGPAGLLLSHLLAADGVESVVLETRSREYVAARIRAGILESSTVDVLAGCGLDDGCGSEGHEHRGIYLQWPEERHHLDFVDLLAAACGCTARPRSPGTWSRRGTRRGQQFVYEISDTALHDLTADRPSVTYVDIDGREQRLEADVIAGCDGSFGAEPEGDPGQGRTDLGANVSLCLVRNPRRCCPVDRRVDLRLASRRVSRCTPCGPRLSAGFTSRSRPAPIRQLVRPLRSGRRWRVGSAMVRTAGS